MEIILVVLVIICLILGYLVWNLLQKNRIYENSIERFYSAVSVVLLTMRLLDEKQIFETDDEVGSVFQQLVDIIANLRPILYGMEPNDNNEKN
jgi:hypothetical protein